MLKKKEMKELQNKSSKKEYNEVLALLELIPSYDYLKIPSEKISILKRNSVKGYDIYIDDINNVKISKKAYTIFMKLYRQYIATDEENKKINEILLLNDKIKNEKYSIVFNKHNEEKTEIVQYEEHKWYKKIFIRILRIFKK